VTKIYKAQDPGIEDGLAPTPVATVASGETSPLEVVAYAETGVKGGAAVGVAPVAPPPAARRLWIRTDVVATPVTEAVRYEISGGRVFFAALVATFVLNALLFVLPLLVGLASFDFPTTTGTMFLPGNHGGAFLLGAAIVFALGVVATFLFAVGLRLALRQSSAHNGFWFGVVLWVVAGFATPFFMAMHPLVQAGQMENPGLFLRHLSPDGILPGLITLIGACLFGATAGSFYRHRKRAMPVVPR
jgi:hypothetical protein